MYQEAAERAIAAYQSALEVFTRESNPQQWAATQNNLGNAYWERVVGDRKQNTEEAIFHYQQALTVYSRADFPIAWATTISNLAAAYRGRIEGDRRDNIERAIELYREALTVITRDAHPALWARIQNELGIAYRNRVSGDRKANLQQAIACYEAALTIFTREAFPTDWATVQRNLGITVTVLIQLQGTNAGMSEGETQPDTHTALPLGGSGPPIGPNDPRLDRVAEQVNELYKMSRGQTAQTAIWSISTMIFGAVLGWLLSLLGTPSTLLHAIGH